MVERGREGAQENREWAFLCPSEALTHIPMTPVHPVHARTPNARAHTHRVVRVRSQIVPPLRQWASPWDLMVQASQGPALALGPATQQLSVWMMSCELFLSQCSSGVYWGLETRAGLCPDLPPVCVVAQWLSQGFLVLGSESLQLMPWVDHVDELLTQI